MNIVDQADQHGCKKDKSEQHLEKKKQKKTWMPTYYTCSHLSRNSAKKRMANMRKKNVTGVVHKLKGRLFTEPPFS